MRLAEIERINAVSVMVGAPAWARGVGTLGGLDPVRTEVGLHLDLTAHPLMLRRRRLPGLVAATYLGAADRHCIRAEIRAQLDRFEATVNAAPRYVDGHQHVHQLPLIREELLAELDRRYRGAVPWIRSTRRAPGMGAPMPPGLRFKAALIESLGAHAMS
ncbi:MAG: ChbG/HpnK family deacetylase, partial [Burkholderiaceae bacterium]